MVIPGLGKIGSKIHAIPAATAGDTGNAEPTDEVRALAWIGAPFALFSLILIPWTVYLAGSLPSEQVSTHYDAAWAGFDVMLMLALAATAYFALRRAELPSHGGRGDGNAAGRRRLVRRPDHAGRPADRVHPARPCSWSCRWPPSASG